MNSAKWAVAKFELPKNYVKKHSRSEVSPHDKKDPEFMVVKASLPRGDHAAHHENERDILLFMNSIEPRHPYSIPSLVWEPEDDSDDIEESSIQFGIQPVGVNLNIQLFATTTHFATAMGKLLDGLDWLHTTATIIHRDIRQPNVVYDVALQTPVLIDYDCAWSMKNSEMAQTSYAGGIICIPHRVLKTYKEEKSKHRSLSKLRYKPKPADDLCAYIILVLTLIYEGHFQLFRDTDVLLDREEGEKRIDELERLFVNIERSPFWGKWWKPATKGKLEKLRKMVPEVAIWPSLEDSLLASIAEVEEEESFEESWAA